MMCSCSGLVFCLVYSAIMTIMYMIPLISCKKHRDEILIAEILNISTAIQRYLGVTEIL